MLLSACFTHPIKFPKLNNFPLSNTKCMAKNMQKFTTNFFTAMKRYITLKESSTPSSITTITVLVVESCQSEVNEVQ